MNNKVELLAPAGNLEKLKFAIIYGADAVYLGGKRFGLRTYGGNFSLKEMEEGILFAHSRKKKVYVTVNIFAHNKDLEGLADYVLKLEALKVDGILVSDLGIFSIVKTTAPGLPVHISTQANTTNWASVNAWEKMGAERIVLARELSLQEIQKIRCKSSAELEMFVHGAMCISYSGRCVMSNYMTGRDSNRGECAQACRWKYSIVEEKRPDEYYPIEEDSHGTYIFNSKDLCLLPYISDIIKSGVNSLKIEGRMKSIYYVAGVVKVYREAIDTFYNKPHKLSELQSKWRESLEKISHRQYTAGFFFHNPTAEDHVYNTSAYTQTADFVGIVLDYNEKTGYAIVEQRNNMKQGQRIELFQPNLPSYYQTIDQMFNDEDNKIAVAPHPQQHVKMKMAHPVEKYAILRRDIV
ncbi:peptidase U32 family protein [Pectinatus sottacetonis]|uniref:peptidase U32 family protein n=1 Tax=Pectinatus sottacetonis TaxID=1002795 RepID=UPI0018C6D3DE|nr:U32 family peptidase [Pectinatus sottacetonis]